MTELLNNMDIYEKARTVPVEAQKQFNNGSFSGTDINPMWRIKKLTELFGPCGIGWYYDIVSERAEEHGDQTMAIVDINLYIKVGGEWSKPIYGTGGNSLKKTTSKGVKTSDEGYKMALTDALSVAAKALGVGADIYFSKDKTKYSPAEEPPREPGPACADCGKEILSVKTRSGEMWPVPNMVKYAESRYGRRLCAACMKNAEKALADAEAYARREDGAEE